MNEKNDPRLAHIDPPCTYCKHIRNFQQNPMHPGWTCAAFPEEIPYLIRCGREPHDSVLPIQEGEYVYESKVYEFENDDGTVETQIITFDGKWVDVEESP